MKQLLFFSFLFLRTSVALDQEITAVPGQTVTLKCQTPNDKIPAGVEWSRPDLEPEYVLLYRNGRFLPHDQEPSFVNRVDLQDRQMTDGDVSLILKEVSTADDGTYECRALTAGGKREKRAIETISTVYLRVSPPGGSVGVAVGLSVAAVVLVAAAAAAVGFVIYRKRSSHQSPASSLPPAVEMQLLHHV